MKRLAILSLVALAAFVFFSACEKENNGKLKDESSIRFMSINPSQTDVNAEPFNIDYAWAYDNYLYLLVTYTGGQMGHEFLLTWDGVVQEIDAKKYIDLLVYHANTDDEGTVLITDSLNISISGLNIPEELLSDKSLYFNVINSSDPSNVFVVPAVYSNDGGTTTNPILYENINVQVVLQGDCNTGAFGNLWLKSLSNEVYFLPKELDSSIEYTPTVNDILKITYERTWLSDSSYYCTDWLDKDIEVITIKELEKVE